MESFAFLGLSAIQSETLSVLLIIAACSAAYCFIVGEITRNNSQMDKLWSILPAVAVIGSAEPFGWKDIVAGILMASFITYEAVADVQQWRFQSAKWAMINSGRKLEELPAPYNKGFNTTGLWKVSRHPNYFAEQSIWVSFYLFSIAAGADILNWSVCGAILLILLFLGSSTLGEHISKSKYPEYAKYIKSVNRYFPGKSY